MIPEASPEDSAMEADLVERSLVGSSRQGGAVDTLLCAWQILRNRPSSHLLHINMYVYMRIYTRCISVYNVCIYIYIFIRRQYVCIYSKHQK